LVLIGLIKSLKIELNISSRTMNSKESKIRAKVNSIWIPELRLVPLANTGLQVSPLAFGTGTNGVRGRSDQSALGVTGLANLLKIGYRYGINFWDTADDYGTHTHIAKALQVVPRDQVVILTKTLARNEDKIRRDLDRILTELKIDAIDIVLLHAMTQPRWPEMYSGAMESLTKAKEQGKVRAVGVSLHSLGALRAAANTEWTEVVMVRINYAGHNMDAQPGEIIPILKQMYRSGKAVIGMKVLAAGNLKQEAKSAIDFVKNLGLTHAMTIGITNQKELIENIRFFGET
jgi:aryl-alcohol dehydrogenase-like predicted oxidoreductase